jgi:peroxiredoxin
VKTSPLTLAETRNVTTACAAAELRGATPEPSHRSLNPAKIHRSSARWAQWLAVAVIFTFATLTRGAPPTVPNFNVDPYNVGRNAPNFIGTDQYGRVISTKKLAGKWVLLNFVTGWSQASAQMSADAQTLANLLRQNKVPFAYLTIVLQDAASNNASPGTALDWAAQYGISDPVIGPNGLAETAATVWDQYFAYSVNPATYSPPADTSTGGLFFPLSVLINPKQKIILSHAGVLTPQAILSEVGRDDLTYTPPPAPQTFALEDFVLAVDAATESSDRVEPTSDLTFLNATFTCDSSVRTDTPFRLTRKFTFPGLGGGSPDTLLKLKTTKATWGASGAGFLEKSAVWLDLKDSTGKVSRFSVPFVAGDVNGEATVGPFKPFQVGAPLGSTFSELSLSLQWTRRPNAVLELQALGEEMARLNLTDKQSRALATLLRTARLAAAPGSASGRAAALLQQLENELGKLSGVQIDAARATHLQGLAASARGILTQNPPASGPALLPAVAATATTSRVASLFRVGQMAPDFSAIGQRGPFKLKSTRGKWVLLDFSAVWCAPCLQMAKSTRSVVDFIESKGIPFEYVTVVTENGNSQPATHTTGLDWAVNFNLRSPVLTPSGLPRTQDLLSRFARYYALANDQGVPAQGVPTVVFINPEGRVARVHLGEVTPEQILSFIHRSDLTYQVVPAAALSLSSYELDITVGTQTAHYNSDTMATTGEYLSPDGGVTPDLKVWRDAYPGSRWREELWFNLQPADDVANFPSNVPVSVKLTNPVWNGVEGLALPYYGGFSVYAPDFTDGGFFGSSLLETPDNGDAGFEFPSLAAVGLTPGFPPSLLQFQFHWMPRDVDIVLTFMQRRLPDLQLPATQNSLLMVTLQSALAAYHKNSPSTAIKQLKRFKTALERLAPGSNNPGVAALLLPAADSMMELIAGN